MSQAIIERTAAEGKIKDILNDLQRKIGMQISYVSANTPYQERQPGVVLVPKDIESVNISVSM